MQGSIEVAELVQGRYTWGALNHFCCYNAAFPQRTGDQNILGLCVTGDCKASSGTAKQV